MKCIPVKLFQREDVVSTSNPTKSFNHRLCKEVNESILNFRYDTNSTNIIQNPRMQKGIKVLNLMLPKHVQTFSGGHSPDHVTSTLQWKNKKLRTNTNNYIDNNDFDNNLNVQNKKLRQNKKINKLKNIKSPKSMIINERTLSNDQCSTSSSTITECSRSVSTTDRDLTSTATITNIIAQSFAQNNDRVQRKMQQTISYFDIDDKSLITEMSKTRESTHHPCLNSETQPQVSQDTRNIAPRKFNTQRNRKNVGKINNYQPKLPVLISPANCINDEVGEIVNNDENCGRDGVTLAALTPTLPEQPLTIITPSKRKKKKKTISISLTQPGAHHRLGDRSPSPDTTAQIIRVDVTSNLSIEYESNAYSSNATSRSSTTSSLPRCNNQHHVNKQLASTCRRSRNNRKKTKFASGVPSSSATTFNGAANIFKYNYYHQVAAARKKMIVRKKEIKLNVPCLKLELNLRNST